MCLPNQTSRFATPPAAVLVGDVRLKKVKASFPVTLCAICDGLPTCRAWAVGNTVVALDTDTGSVMLPSVSELDDILTLLVLYTDADMFVKSLLILSTISCTVPAAGVVKKAPCQS